MKEELTFSQRYEIPLTLEVNNFRCDYYHCGSHQMELKVEMEAEAVLRLLTKIKSLPAVAVAKAINK